MANNSNLYAEKIFAEHPLALYPLDETIDYVSLIPESTRYMQGWSITNATVTSAISSTSPFPSSSTGTITPGGTTSCTLQSAATFTIPPLDSFAIGFYFFVGNAATATSIDIGYRIGAGTAVTANYAINTNDTNKWVFVSKTFTSTAGVSPSGASVYIKLNYASPTGTMLINGISVGSWSEEFNSKSLGILSTVLTQPTIPQSNTLYQLPSTINIPTSNGVISSAYSNDTDIGYYISANNKIFARSSSVPLVYGSQNATILSPNDTANQPSFVMPGYGFLNENGKYAERTFEGWFRINAVNPVMRKIFGPLGHTDGLYANGGCLILKINKNFISYNLDEWNKPMLVQIQIGINSASLFVNGENAGSMYFDSASTPFQASIVSSKNADWLGVYAYATEVESVELDCLAIYSYKIPIELTKKRFIYGQGVNYPETLDFLFNGSSFVTENSTSNALQVYNYPVVGKWKEGIVNNVLPSSRSITVPDYALPSIVIDTASTPISTTSVQYTESTFLEDLYATNTTGTQFITMKPTTVVAGTSRNWSTVDSYLLFNKFQMLYDNVVSFYGIFTATESSASEQYLMRIEDNKNNNFSISILGTTVSYKFNGTTLSFKSITVNTAFGVGLDIPAIISANANNSDLVQFWSNLYQLKMYVGGSSITTTNGTSVFPGTFSGKIFRVAFSNSRNHDSGNFTSGYWSRTSNIANYSAIANLASYSLFAKRIVDTEILDIGISGNWQKDIPLQYFSTYLVDGTTYTFDYLQFNIDNPESDSTNINTYITLQNNANGANAFSESYGSVTNPTNYLVDSATVGTKYRVYDGTIIYPDAAVNKETTSIVTHIDFSVAGIKTNPIKINTIKLTSQLMSSGSSYQNSITSRYALNLTPYGTTYKPKIGIYSVDNPYLFLTNKSGIQNLSNSINQDSGYSADINYASAKLNFIQMTFKNNIDLGTTPLQLFSISAQDKVDVIFYLNNIGNRYYIEAKQGSTVLYQNNADIPIKYYWNGTNTFSPTFRKNEWGTLGISFVVPYDLSGVPSKIKINGPSLIQNFAYYLATEAQSASKETTISWSSALSGTWSSATSGKTWTSLGTTILRSETMDIPQLYSVYTGTNVITANIDDKLTSSYLKLGKYEYVTYTGIRTQLKETIIV